MVLIERGVSEPCGLLCPAPGTTGEALGTPDTLGPNHRRERWKNHWQIKELGEHKESILTHWVGKHWNRLNRKVSNGRVLRNLRQVNQALS